MSVIPVVKRQSQEDHCKFKASVGYKHNKSHIRLVMVLKQDPVSNKYFTDRYMGYARSFI